MSAAGLVTDLLFRAVRIPASGRPPVIAATHFQWNYTAYLNIVETVTAKPAVSLTAGAPHGGTCGRWCG